MTLHDAESVAERTWGLTVREVIQSLLNLPPTCGDHPTMDALLQFTFDGETFFAIDWIDDLGEGGVVANLAPLDGAQTDGYVVEDS